MKSIGAWRWIIASPYGPEKPTVRHLLHVMAMFCDDGGACTTGTRRLASMLGISREVCSEHRDAAATAGWLIPPLGFGTDSWSTMRHQRLLPWLPAVPDPHTEQELAEKARQWRERVAGKVRQSALRSGGPSGGHSQPVVADISRQTSNLLHIPPAPVSHMSIDARPIMPDDELHASIRKLVRLGYREPAQLVHQLGCHRVTYERVVTALQVIGADA